jgi:ribose 5-phosphate isomerase B
VAIAADHAGLDLKRELSDYLRGLGYEIHDLGNHVCDPTDDYPDFSEALAETVAEGRADRGLLVCGSGIGASVAANKVPGVRAGLAHDTYSAHQGVEHDDMNVLVLGSRVVGSALAQELARTFLEARFSGEERHLRRLSKVQAIERHYLRECGPGGAYRASAE